MKGLTNMEPMSIVARELLECINDIWEKFAKCPPVDSALVLSEVPIFLKRTHRYSLIFLRNPVNLLIDICGIGSFHLTLYPGWNDLSLPDKTKISLVSGKLSAIHRCTDVLR
jgi:hypothetical protein